MNRRRNTLDRLQAAGIGLAISFGAVAATATALYDATAAGAQSAPRSEQISAQNSQAGEHISGQNSSSDEQFSSQDVPGQPQSTQQAQLAAPQHEALPGRLNWARWRERARIQGDLDEKEPITIDGRLRHPMMYFAHVNNRPWRPLALLGFILAVSAMLKIFLPRLTAVATNRCRTNLYASFSSAFIYATVLISIIRFSFFNEDIAPMGVFTTGLLQVSFALGGCLGANLFAENFYRLFTRQSEPANPAARALLYGSCLAFVAVMLTLVSLIPNIGHLPRLGNRVVMLVAALGLGGLVNVCAVQAKVPAESQG